jgi:hypothetical protein
VAFPFGWNPPSLGDFVAKCTTEFGAEVMEMDYEVEGSHGPMRPRILERKVDGKTCHVVLPNLPDDVLISFHLIRNMCDRLAIPTEAFKFEFDRDTGLVKVE